MVPSTTRSEQLASCTTRTANQTNAARRAETAASSRTAVSSRAASRARTGSRGTIGGQAGNGPVAADFVDITKVAPNVQGKPRRTGNASTGTFTSRCGVNANKNFNTDNVIVAPGVTNGAHHLHDYVGNQKINAFSSNNTFLQGGTSCQNRNDLSSYYWPVVRIQDGTQEFDQNRDGGGKEGNVGRISTPVQAQIKYVGSPASKVVPMPQFLRISSPVTPRPPPTASPTPTRTGAAPASRTRCS